MSNLTFVAFVTDYVTSTVTFAVFVTGLITLFDPLFITYASYEIYFKHQLYFRWKVDLHWQFGKLKNLGMHLSHLALSINVPLQKHSPWELQVLFIDPASSQLHSWQLPSDLLKYPLSHSSHLVPVYPILHLHFPSSEQVVFSMVPKAEHLHSVDFNIEIFTAPHGVWKSQKKSHSSLRAKRATFTFWMDKSSLKNAKNGQFWRVFENLKLAVKQCYQTGQF